MTTVLFLVASAALVVGSAMLWREGRRHIGHTSALVERVGGVLSALEDERSRPPAEADTGQIAARVRDLEDEVETLKLAVAEGIQHVERAENRIKATVRRAQKRLEDAGFGDDGLEGEARGLFGVDGEGSEGERMPSVHENLERAPTRRSGFPGRF